MLTYEAINLNLNAKVFDIYKQILAIYFVVFVPSQLLQILKLVKYFLPLLHKFKISILRIFIDLSTNKLLETKESNFMFNS